MKVTAARVRFLLEAAFLVMVAAVCWAADLSWKGIVPAMAAAWAIVTFVERSAAQEDTGGRRFALPFRRERGESGVAEQEPLPEPERSPPPSHATVLEPEAEEHPPTPLPEPEPPAPAPEPPAPEPAPPAPEPEPPRPEPDQPTPQLQAVPEPPPAPEPERQPEPERDRQVVAFVPRADGAPREWNIWELERLAHEREGEDATRDDELAFLLLELRQFANADGQLPASFDPVVREAFGELLYTTP